MGRKRKKIDVEALVALAANNVTKVDIAALLGCSVDTLDRRYSKMIDTARAGLKRDLARTQIEVAKGRPAEYVTDNKGEIVKDGEGNPLIARKELPPDSKLLIWMGKQLLGQKDKTDVTSDDKPIVTVAVIHGVSMDDL